MAMKDISQLLFTLSAFAVFEFCAVLSSGRGGSWAFPTVLAFIVITSIAGLVLGIRAQRAQSRGR
jgi:hypothetical protein